MARRVKLGEQIAIPQQSTVTFSPDGRQMIITLSLDSEQVPDVEQTDYRHNKRHSHRDLINPAGGDLRGTDLRASLFSAGEGTVLTVSTKLNTKVPGTGPA